MDTRTQGNRLLIAASAALVGAVVLHGADHVLQERGVDALTTQVRVGGFINAALAVIVLVMALRDHPRTPLVAAAVGAYLVVGVTAAHFAPHWSSFSDPYSEVDLGFVSWAAAAIEVAAAAALSAVGFAVMRQRRTLAEAAPS